MQRVLDEMTHMEARLADTVTTRCVAALEQRLEAAEQKTEARVVSLETNHAEMERRLGNLVLEMNRATKFMERETMAHESSKPGLIPAMGSAFGHSAAGIHVADGPEGHRVDFNHRERESGRIPTPSHDPVKGTCYGFPSHHMDAYNQSLLHHNFHGGCEGGRSGHGRLPHINFPQFDGTNPQLWKARCEDYFDMYDVEPYMWIKVAIMHFTGRAASWLQSTERRIRQLPWPVFCAQIHDRFGRDQHESLIRKLFHIRQIGSVAEYVEQFSVLVDHLAAYEAHADPLYYTMRFVDGLRDDIKSVIMVQRPTTLDTACSLALVQEEAVLSRRGSRSEATGYKGSWKNMDTPSPSGATKENELTKWRTSDDKVTALRRFRRAKGLCEKCAEKWTPGHKCVATAQLHAMEEVWNLFTEDTAAVLEDGSDTVTADQLFMSISNSAWLGSEKHQTLKLHGSIQQQPLLILLDSGSSHTFVNEKLLPVLQGVQPVSRPLKVQVANGTLVVCSHQLLQAHWYIHEYEFVSDIKFLPLPCFDMVVGMDWLSSFSPMRVDWAQKWLTIPYNGHNVRLQGQSQVIPNCTVIELLSLETSATPVQHSNLHPRIQSLLQQYVSVFSDPIGLPPNRECDHRIPLVPGAQPFSVKPYRYPPKLKDEIEQQVQDMLQQGVIQKSSSAFASPVLLVKKKDGTWRFCVDYRYLNAITVKSKYPVPVFDQLMDELAHAKWFSKLDLKAGYHQIRLTAGEEHKTAFQTHIGHYEFRVMAFGLTGAPNTFLGAMNDTLKSVLRKCVLVFFDDILIYSQTFEDHLLHLQEVFQLLLND